MFKWLKSLLGENKEGEAANNDNSGAEAENAMPPSEAEGGEEAKAAGMSETGDVSMGVSSEEPSQGSEEGESEGAEAPQSPASEEASGEEGSDEEKAGM